MSPYTSLVLAGIAGGTFGAVASHPFDTAKTRMQVGGRGAWLLLEPGTLPPELAALGRSRELGPKSAACGGSTRGEQRETAAQTAYLLRPAP